MKVPTRSYRLTLAVTLWAGTLAGVLATSVTSAAAAAPATLDLNVLLIGTGSSDPTTGAWQSALSSEGVAYTLATATGSYGSETVTLPALTTGSVGNFNGVVVADSPAEFAAGQLSALDTYEATFGVDQVDGSAYPYLGETDVSAGALDGTTGQLTAAGLAALPELAGPVPFATGTYGYPSSVNAGAPFTPWLENTAGNVLAGVYQHPSTDPQAGVSELELNFNYNSSMLQWLLLAPGLINWVTQGTHLGLYRNYIEMDIDDTFTPDNAWSTAVHDNDYSDANSLRMQPQDVVNAAEWSQGTSRPTSVPPTPFRMDQLFNFGGSVEYQNGELDLPGEPTCTAGTGPCGADPLLAEFQAADPTTGKPYADDFGWISHTYDTPYLDVGCATQDYIEAELNENTSSAAAPPGTTAGTGGLGLTESTIPAGSMDLSDAYGTENPDVFVPGNHSGFADLEPGTPATVDPPDLGEEDVNTTGGTLPAGTYEYAVADQFNGADLPSVDQSQAYVTTPLTVTGRTGSVSLVWQAICHAANYIIYRAPISSTGTAGPWTEVGTYATPASATLPDNSSADSSPASTTEVCQGPSYDPTSCAGEQELTFTDTGGTATTPPAGVTYLDTAMPTGWTPPVVEDANELPWEQNPYFVPALQAVGITTVGADASKAYPNPPNDQFGVGADYTGSTYAAGQPFVDGTSQVAPRHPVNIFYNAATNAQELDEYNTLYSSVAPGSQCQNSSVTTCSSTLYTFSEVVSSIVSQMFDYMLTNNPETTYVHQTNLMGTPPYSSVLPPTGYVPAATAQTGTDGDGLLYEVLNPLLAEYAAYFNANTPYEQPTLGGIGNILANQTAWASTLSTSPSAVTASETNGVVTIFNTGPSVAVPVTAPLGTLVDGSAFGDTYGGAQSGWLGIGAGTPGAPTQVQLTPAAGLASQTISFTAPASGTVGGQATLSATGGGSGNPVVFSVDAASGTGVCNVSGTDGTTLDYTAAGNCVIDADQAGNANYAAASQVEQTIVVAGTKANQTITFGALANKTLAQSPVTVSATASSGLAVTFTTATASVCTSRGTNGASITLVKAGTCTVEANQAGNATYNAAPEVSQSFTVSKASQTITFANPGTKTKSPVTVSATASSGLAVTFTTATASVCTSGGTNGASITLVKAGTCTVEANQAGNATYNAAPEVSQSFRFS